MIFRVKTQGLAFLVVPGSDLIEGIVGNTVFLQGENLRSLIGQRQRLCIVSFLEALLLENLLSSPGAFFGGGQSVDIADHRSPWQGLFSLLLCFIFLFGCGQFGCF